MLFCYLAVSALYLFLILGVLMRGLSTHVVSAYVIYVSGLLLWTITLYLYFYVDLGTWLLFVGRLNFATGILIAGGLSTFFYYFPDKTWTLPKKVEQIFFWFSGAFTLLIIFTPLVDAKEIYTPAGPIFIAGKLYPLFLFYLIGNLIAIIAEIQKLFALTGLARVRLAYAFWTFTPSFALTIFFNVFLPYFGILIWQAYSFVLMTPVALASFYVIYNYQLFSFSYLVLKILRGSLLSLIFGGAILFVHNSLASANVVDWFNNLGSAVIGLSVLTLANKIFPPLLTRDFREFQTQLRNLRVTLSLCEASRDLREILEEVFTLQLNITFIRIFVTTSTLAKTNFAVYPPDALTHVLESKKRVLLAEELLASEAGIASAHLGEAVLFLPLLVEKKLIGLLVLGKKSDRSSYSAEEICELEKMQPKLANCLANVLLQENILGENDLLKNIVTEKTRQLQEQNKKNQQLVKQQSDFITLAAHELRTPLSVTLLQIEQLKKILHQFAPKTHAEFLVITEALQKMNRLVDTIFDAQMLDLNKVHLTLARVKIKKFCTKFCDDLRPIVEQKGLVLKTELEWNDQLEVELDPLLIEQVLRNLIMNALRFSPARGTITLRGETSDGYQRITVTDEGPGISPIALENIFKKFWRQPGKQEKGAGLGLYICKKIIELHGGVIRAENRKNKGAQISFTLWTKKHAR